MLRSQNFIRRTIPPVASLRIRQIEQSESVFRCNSQTHYYSTLIDPDFLHQSIVPTNYFQKSLPRLPIPKLHQTCERYLKAQQILLNNVDYTETEAVIKNFKETWGWF